MGTVEITFVRHAETISNREGIWQGQSDSRLSEHGVAQAEALGRRLDGERFDRVVCSDLRRTCDTLAAVRVPEVAFDASWREIHVGRWEGLSRDEVRRRFPEEIDALKRGVPIPIGGGESWRDLESRVDAALARLRAELPDGGRALVMTHGGVVHAVMAGLFGLRDRRARPIGRIMNTAITVVRLAREPARTELDLVRYNDASHVGPESEYLREHLAAGASAVAVAAEDAGDGAPGEATDEVEAQTAPWRSSLARWHGAFAGTALARADAAAGLAGLETHAVSGHVRAVRADGRAAASFAHSMLGGPKHVRIEPLPAGSVAHFLFRGPVPALGDYALTPLPFFEP